MRTSRVEQLEPRRMLSTYYVSPAGSDSFSGAATTAAWKTLARVNQQNLKAGDKVLFQGGKSWIGSLSLTSTEGGTSASPVTFTTYGAGRATIYSSTAAGFDIA